MNDTVFENHYVDDYKSCVGVPMYCSQGVIFSGIRPSPPLLSAVTDYPGVYPKHVVYN